MDLLTRKGTVIMTKVFGVLAITFLSFFPVPCIAQDEEDKPPERLPSPAEARVEKPAAEVGKTPPALPVQSGEPCGYQGHRHADSCLHHLLAWATYRPLSHGCGGCVKQCVPVCTPPLYTFFPCQGFGDCGPEGCTSCGESAGPSTKDCLGIFHHRKE